MSGSRKKVWQGDKFVRHFYTHDQNTRWDPNGVGGQRIQYISGPGLLADTHSDLSSVHSPLLQTQMPSNHTLKQII